MDKGDKIMTLCIIVAGLAGVSMFFSTAIVRWFGIVEVVLIVVIAILMVVDKDE